MPSTDPVTVTGVAATGQRLNRVAINARRQGERALNLSARAGRKTLIDTTGQQLNLPKAYIGGLFTVTSANAQRLESSIVGRKRPVQLARFQARQVTAAAKTGRRRVKAGVSVQVKKSGGRVTIKDAFFAPLNKGGSAGGNGKGVFRRKGEKRYPIEVLLGPSPDQVFTRVRPELARKLTGDLRADLQARLANLGSAP